jgi:hypothetical protein
MMFDTNHVLGTTQVGDQGQQYEVHAKWKHNSKDFIVGWTDRVDGGGVFVMAQKHPNMRGAYLLDRRTKQILQGGKHDSSPDSTAQDISGS